MPWEVKYMDDFSSEEELIEFLSQPEHCLRLGRTRAEDGISEEREERQEEILNVDT